MMHIVQVANFVTPTSGGQRLALNSLAEQYLKHGHETTLVIPGEKHETRIEDRRKIVSLCGLPVPFSGGYRAIVRKDQMQQTLAELQPDIVELSDKTTLSWVPQWCRQMGIACVVFSHERASEVVSERFPKWLPVGPVFRRWGENIEQNVDAIVCASKYSAEEYAQIGERVKVIPLGVDHETFKPNGFEYRRDSRAKSAKRKITILFAGRLSFEKRPHVVLLAARALSLRGVAAKFVIAGDGPMRRQLVAMADGLDVTFLGRISGRQELAALMSSADLAIAPSPFETFGLSILEILACGTPVIVADAGAGMEIVDASCGAIASPDGDSMADAVEAMMQRDLEVLRKNCVARAATFDWSITAASMIGLFESLSRKQALWAA